MDVAQLMQQEVKPVGFGAAGPRGRFGSYRVLYLPALELEENAPGSGAHRHLRQAWKSAEAAFGQTCQPGRSPSGNRTSKIPGLGCIAGSTPLPPRVGRSGQISKTRADRSADPSGHRRVLTASFRLANWKRISYAYFAMRIPQWSKVDTKWYLGVRC